MTNSRPPTIAQVAALAGVSAPTVSRVVNGTGSVQPAMRERVLDAVQRLGYRPSPMARGLRTGRSATLACIVPFVSNPSAVDHVRGIVDGLRSQDSPLSLYDVESPGDLESHIEHLVLTRPAGLIVVALRLRDDTIDRFTADGTPIVLIDTSHDAVSGVVLDEHAGAALAADHLVQLGHRRIAFVGDDEDNEFGFTSSRERRVGLERALERLGHPLDPRLVRRGTHGRSIAAGHTTELLALDDPPTAILAASDTQALGASDAVRSAGLAVGGDVSVIGFDDIATAADVGLTTVNGHLVHAGARAAELLTERLDGSDRPPETIILDARLEIRTSTGPPPAPR